MSQTRTQLLKNLAGKRVLLVGGAGFIGHNLALTLRRHGATVMVADNLMHNNLVSNVTQGDSLEGLRRRLYQNFLVDRFQLMRDAGFRPGPTRALPQGAFGPPAPEWWSWRAPRKDRRPPERGTQPALQGGAFAALAGLVR